MRYTFAMTAFLAIAIQAGAQTDSTEVEAEKKKNNAISIGVSSKTGGYAKLETVGDSTRKPEPFKIETKRKIITIISEPKPFSSVQDSVDDRKAELRKDRRKMFTYWSGLDVGVNTLMGSDGDTDLSSDEEFMEIDNARSRFFAINFHEVKLEFGSHHAGLMTGLGLEFTSYHLKNNVLLQYNADSVYALQVEKPEFRKNKLRQIGLRIPLMLEFNTKRAPIPTDEQLRSGESFSFDRKKNVHLAAGLVGSWYFNTMYKQKYRGEDGRMLKEKDNGDYLLMPYRVAASVRVGYGAWNFFAEYALTPFFKEDKGPELTAFNVGLTIIGFN